MKIQTLEGLLGDCLKDIFSAEGQILKALPRMAKAATADVLKEAFKTHVEETKAQVARLEEIAAIMGLKLSGKKCKAMEGLIEEAKEIIDADGDDTLIDAALIGAAQKVEHYEISAYGTARALAEKLELEDVAALLQETLDEESATDEKLTQISLEDVLANFGDGAEDDDEEAEEQEEPVPPKKKSAVKATSKAGKR